MRTASGSSYTELVWGGMRREERTFDRVAELVGKLVGGVRDIIPYLVGHMHLLAGLDEGGVVVRHHLRPRQGGEAGGRGEGVWSVRDVQGHHLPEVCLKL